MTHELDGLSVPLSPLYGPPMNGAGSVLDQTVSSYKEGLSNVEAALSPALRKGSVAYYAVRRILRMWQGSLVVSGQTASESVALRRWIGIGSCMVAWMTLLIGLAHLFVAAVHNRDGELGLGLESTLIGARACLISFGLALFGVPMWVVSERRIRREREQLRHEEATRPV